MRLGRLRKIKADYDKIWYARSFISGPHERAKIIQVFLDLPCFSEKKDDYQLSSLELYSLAQIIFSLKDDLPLIKSIKEQFNNYDIFSQVFIYLETNKLLNEKSFVDLHALEINQLELMHRLYCSTIYGAAIFTNSQLTSHKLFKTVLNTVKVSTSITHFEFCLKRLSGLNLLNDKVLKLLDENVKYMSQLYELISLFESFALLNNSTLELISPQPSRVYNHSEVYNLVNLFTACAQQKIGVDESLLKLMVQNSNLYTVNEVCSSLIQASERLFDVNFLTLILNIDFSSLLQLPKMIRLLDKNKILTAEFLKLVIDNKDLHSLGEALKLLSKNGMLDALTFKQMATCNSSLYDFYIRGGQLAELKLLNKDTLNLLFSEKISVNLLYVLSVFSSYVTDKTKLLNSLMSFSPNNLMKLNEILTILEGSIELNENRVDQLLALSNGYYSRMKRLLSDLKELGELNEGSFLQLIKNMNKKLAKPQEEKILVEQGVDGPNSWTKYHDAEDKVQVYVSHDANKETLSGARAYLLQGCSSMNKKSASYLIKISKEKDQSGNDSKEARREAKGANFFGRHAHLFQNSNKWGVILDKQEGKSLDQIESDKLSKIPFLTRFTALPDVFKRLSNVHDEERVHGDIKTQNCLYDEKLNLLKLIDFGSMRKLKDRTYELAWTPHYLDQNISRFSPGNHYSFGDDIYALGIVIAQFFPELYSVQLDESKTNVSCSRAFSKLSFREQAIVHLVSAMIDPQREKRCTSATALTYCELVIQRWEYLESMRLEEILLATLKKSDCSLDDILHDHKAARTMT